MNVNGQNVMAEPEPLESNTRAIVTPHNATNPEATTPERVRQVELNRLRGRCSLSPSPLSLVPFGLTTYYCGNTQPRQDDAKKRLLLPLPPSPPCATPTIKDPSPSSPRPPTPRPARRTITTIITSMPAPEENYGAMHVSGSTLIMICQRWSIRKVVSSSRMIGEQPTM